MEGFKSNTKMQCFKEGGSVKYKSRKSEMAEEKKDITKDVGMIKKGVKQHEEARHKGEPKTKLKLKTGGRSKVVGKYKAGGSIAKYQAGRSVTGAAMTDAEKARMNLTGAAQTEEEKARMPAGKLPQQVVDEEAMAANTETREMVAGPIRKLKQGIMEKFKSKTKTPMRKGGSTCR